MVAADRETVAIARNHPDVEFRIRKLHARRNRRCSAVDRVEAIRREIIWKARGTADTGYKYRVLPFYTHIGQRGPHTLNNGVIAAPGTPANPPGPR